MRRRAVIWSLAMTVTGFDRTPADDRTYALRMYCTIYSISVLYGVLYIIFISGHDVSSGPCARIRVLLACAITAPYDQTSRIVTWLPDPELKIRSIPKS